MLPASATSRTSYSTERGNAMRVFLPIILLVGIIGPYQANAQDQMTRLHCTAIKSFSAGNTIDVKVDLYIEIGTRSVIVARTTIWDGEYEIYSSDQARISFRSLHDSNLSGSVNRLSGEFGLSMMHGYKVVTSMIGICRPAKSLF
jgi:hypothetical protein